MNDVNKWIIMWKSYVFMTMSGGVGFQLNISTERTQEANGMSEISYLGNWVNVLCIFYTIARYYAWVAVHSWVSFIPE